MERTEPQREAALSGLLRANARPEDVLARMDQGGRVDVGGLPAGAVALMVARATRAGGPGWLVLTPDGDAADRMAADLRFFLGPHEGKEILRLPEIGMSPYLDVAPDRRASMDRLATLFHLAQGLPFRALVAPVSAVLRRVPPREAIRRGSMVVETESELDRDALLSILVTGGYLRVPVAEDPGTFAVRGGIIDVYAPHARYPARIELDDWLVLSIKHFDPDDQRTVGDAERLFVHPAREAILGREELDRARTRVRALCDEVNLPTTRTRQLLDELESGRLYFGLEGLLPAFYPELETLFAFLPESPPVCVVDPTATVRAAEDLLERAEADRVAKVEEQRPAFPLAAHFMTREEVAEALSAGPLALVHRLAVAGAPGEEEASPLSVLESVDPNQVLLLGGQDQTELTAALRSWRIQRQDALGPLEKRIRAWIDAGLRVVLSARSETQAERLGSLLGAYGLPVTRPTDFHMATLERPPDGRVHICAGTLQDGFVLATEALSCVTEEEIFGSRAHRRTARRRDREKRTAAFLEDLRQLKPGDFIVHIDHGIGRYQGLEHKAIGQSALERMRGDAPRRVEVLVVEYAGRDKLYLPVTRLNQIQKFAGQDGHAPKLDRLGGQTFAKTKARVNKSVRRLADQLLDLYARRAASRRKGLGNTDRVYTEFEATFPFEETPDQARAIEDVLADLSEGKPMDRLVCGDVGFGKTEVALRAAFRVAMSGKQVAMLCPTTVLAQQHYLTFRERLEGYPLKVEVLSRFVDKKKQTAVLAGLKDGTVDVVVGTHRLLSKDVHAKNLGLLIVDEEQRFGVTHKERLKSLRAQVDVLTLSATPIPRTLQMAVGGIRDLSLITTPPVDRRAVRTIVCRWDDQLIKDAIDRELSRGGQVFFVYNRIEGLYERAQRLAELAPHARIAVAHGQMKEGMLERAMTDFVEGRIDVLASTAIVESGLDIPRANTILIDRADMFGLAQLYQLRGRVGRAKERAYCYLVTPPPTRMTDEARSRMEALERFTELGSGFHVATLDMEQRGAGDLLGAEQSGNVSAVGFDLFIQMLEDAVSLLRGEPVVRDVDTELTLDVEHYLPDDYIDDVGLRLSFYKRFASAESEAEVEDLATEMEDRFGRPPPQARELVRAMTLKPALRELKVLGCEATRSRVTLHLREDTPLDPAKVMERVTAPASALSLSPDMKLTRRFDPELEGDALTRVTQLLGELAPLRKNDSR